MFCFLSHLAYLCYGDREKIKRENIRKNNKSEEVRNMKLLLTGSPAKTITVLLTTLFTVLFFSAAASAAVYDDFNNSGIDSNKWIATGTGFSQPGDGYLHYNGATPVNEQLISTAIFTSGTITMPFADYSSNNTAPPGLGLGSVVALGLGSRNSGAWVRIERGQVIGTTVGQYIEVNWAFRINSNQWSNIYVNYVQSDITSGELQLRYDGTDVTFFYRTAKTGPWTQMVITGEGGQPVLDGNGQVQPLVVTPGWTTAVPIFIQAIPGGANGTPSYTLSFKIDNVRIRSIAVAHIMKNLRNIITRINNLETDYFKNANQQNTLINKLRAVARMVNHGSYAEALDKLQNDILQKLDGCAVKTRPDKNDWITDCDGQNEVYPDITEIISLLQGTI
jgi:hypothetical protein